MCTLARSGQQPERVFGFPDWWNEDSSQEVTELPAYPTGELPVLDLELYTKTRILS